MNKIPYITSFTFFLSSLTLAVFSSCSKETSFATIPMTYPESRQSDHIDTYFGNTVSDPFRWMEDDYAEETKAWVEAQNKVSFEYLEKIPFREAVRSRLEHVWDFERISAPSRHGEYLYYSKNDGLQNQAVIYRKKNHDGEEELFLDPNQLSEDGSTSLGGTAFTKSGKFFAYALSVAGSDWRDIYVMNAETKELLKDKVIDAKFTGIAWKGEEGFYYSTYEKPGGSKLSALTNNHKLYYHTIGTDQKEDRLVFGSNDDPKRYVGAEVTEDGAYLIITASNSTSGNALYIQSLASQGLPIIPVVISMDDNHWVVDHQDGDLFISTNLNAPNNRLVKTSVSALDSSHWVDVIPESEFVMEISKGGGKLFASYLKDAITEVRQHDYSGRMERIIELPGIGTAGGFNAKREEKELYYTFTSYVSPATSYQYNIDTGNSEIYFSPKLDFLADDYESTQVFYASNDGIKIPLIITHRKGLELDGKNPTILYGYGGFNVSLTPSFSVANTVWLENGGVYAVPNIRGGGEYGEEWHLAGTKLQKQQVFDDFIAAAEYLIEKGYTSSEFLALRGGSNGGLLVGAVMIQRPDLAKVALPAVGVLDMLRYHQFTAGAGWGFDYGTAEDSEEMFTYLKGYSPLHNLKSGTKYPSTLITTADHDDRVVPAHSFKFAAALQQAHAGENPVLIRIETNAGHGAGKPTSKVIEEIADVFSFTWYQMGIDYPRK